MASFQAVALRLWREPFDDPAWCFALKYDGFRALPFVERDTVRFVSRTESKERAESRASWST